MFKKIRIILRPYKFSILPVFFLMFFSSIFEVISIGSIIPLLAIITDQNFYESNYFINYFITNIYFLDKKEFVLACFVFLFLAFLLRFVLISLTIWVKNKFTYSIQKDISKKMLNIYFYKNYDFFFKENIATLVNNVDKESHHFVVGLLSPLLILMIEFLAIFFILSFLFYYDPISTISIFSIILIFSLVFILFTREKLNSLGKDRKINENYINKILIEGFSGFKDIKLVQAENLFIKKFTQKIKNLCGVMSKQKTIDELSRPIFEFIGVIGLIGFLLYFYLVDKNLSEIFIILGIFLAASLRLMPSANRIITSIQSIRFFKPTVDIIFKELNEIKDKNNFDNVKSYEKLNLEKKIHLKKIYFSYPGTSRIIFKDLDLDIKKGEFVGIYGESGSGKTTFVDLLSGFLNPDEGEILCDNNNIKNNQGSWKQLIGYVPQSIFLTDDTIKNNICLGVEKDSINFEALNMSIEKAQLKKLIKDLPDGLDTIVGDRGIGLSLGQIQRIGIARALYWQKPIIIFDESTNSLDSQNEKEIINVIRELRNNKTIIFISHDLDLLKSCDKIFKLINQKLELIK